MGDDSAGDTDAGVSNVSQLIQNASRLQDDDRDLLEMHHCGASSTLQAFILPEVMPSRGLPFTSGLKMDEATKLLGNGILEGSQVLTRIVATDSHPSLLRDSVRAIFK